jgi:hypothetical protein
MMQPLDPDRRDDITLHPGISPDDQQQPKKGQKGPDRDPQKDATATARGGWRDRHLSRSLV